MPRYLKANKNYLFDYSKNLVLALGKRQTPFIIETPFFLWESGDKTDITVGSGFRSDGAELQTVLSIYRYTESVRLNRLAIHYNRASSCQASVLFYDKRIGRELMFDIVYELDRRVVLNSRGMRTQRICGVDVSLVAEGSPPVHYRVDYSTSAKQYYGFKYMRSLGKVVGEQMQYSYGVVTTPCKIVYQGKLLNGDTLTFVSGPWAILLDDDYTFDTLVLLKGASSGILDVDRFVYTVNTYILKLMMLNP